jgi:hypothetical protein
LKPDLEYEVMSILAIDWESFAVLHADAISHWGYPSDFPVDEILDVLEKFVESGWVTASFLGNSEGPPTSAALRRERQAYLDWLQDEGRPGDYNSTIGPWYRLTPAGKGELRRREKERGDA